MNAVMLGLAWLASLGAVFILGILSAFAIHLGPGAGGQSGDLSLDQRAAMLVIERYSGKPADIAAVMAVGSNTGIPDQLEQAVRAILRSGDPAERERASALLVAGLPSRQVMGVIKVLQEIPANPARDQVLGVFLEAWAVEDGRRAIIFATSLPAPAEQELAVESVLKGWSRERPEDAWAWVIDQSGSIGRAERWLAIIVSSMGSVDRSTALRLLEEMPESDFRNQLAGIVMDQLLLNLSPREAINWLGEFPGSSVFAAAAVLAGEWARTEPRAATQWLFQSYPSNLEGLMAPLSEWVYDDPKGAMDWVWTSIQGVRRQSLLDAAAGEWLANDGPAPLANWLNANGPHPFLDGAVSQLALQTADYDPATAMVWAHSVNDPGNRSTLEIVIGRRWIEMDPQAAAQELPRLLQTEPARAALLEPPPEDTDPVTVAETVVEPAPDEAPPPAQ